jgi:site-specific DNA recombinase
VIYCRVSTKEQAQTNLSLPVQKKVCVEYCEREGLDVDKLFMERGESAKTIDRPEFQKLLSYCRQNKGRVQVVVVYDLSRFARDNVVHFAARAALHQYGVTLRSATQQIDDTSTGAMMEGVLATFAYFDNKQKAERTVRGMKDTIAEGRWTFFPPLGYRRAVDPSGKSNIEPDPTRAPFVRQAFDLYATGLYTKAQVLRIVTGSGLRTARGASVSLQTFQQTLRNPIYAGWLTVKSWEMEPTRGNFEPLVTDKVFTAVQAVLDGKKLSLTPQVRNRADFPLRGFVKCGDCGRPLTASWSKGRRKHYGYYRCWAPSCRAVNMSKDGLEKEFVDYLGSLKPARGLMTLFREIVLDLWQKKQVEAVATVKVLERKLADLKSRKDRLVGAFVYQQAIDKATYEDQNDKLAEDIALAEMELHDAHVTELDVEGVLNFAEHVIQNASRMWLECSAEQKQRLQKVLFPNGMTYSNGTLGTTEISPVFRMLELLPSRSGRDGSGVEKEELGTAETAMISKPLHALPTPEVKPSVPDGI